MTEESWYRRPEGTGKHASAGGIGVRVGDGRPLLGVEVSWVGQ